ncbi:hypothetical protein AF332_19135 [Sporosarcina globispora]|uniref:Uncharacterized protein n=1 Tax=Sporosarcina globispora TaxID=1459 RepID=A0A0M0GFL2_SPOGL|nr:hypothetical protein AF332_19135 [Sporosarcina globispora]
MLQQLYKIGGPESIIIQLSEYHKSAEKNYINHWKSAMYEALSSSDWFCYEAITTYGQSINN